MCTVRYDGLTFKRDDQPQPRQGHPRQPLGRLSFNAALGDPRDETLHPSQRSRCGARTLVSALGVNNSPPLTPAITCILLQVALGIISGSSKFQGVNPNIRLLTIGLRSCPIWGREHCVIDSTGSIWKRFRSHSAFF